MRIRKIDTHSRKDVTRFIRFPVNLYRGNPYYCPVLDSEARFSLDRTRHPFYLHSTADFFLAESEGQVIGRIAVLHNVHHNEFHQVKTAFFASFDVIDDFQVAEQLFESAFAWSRSQGRHTILGPRGQTGTDGAGVLVEGFDQPASMGVPYNFPYYDTFITALGFSKLTDHLSGSLSAHIALPPRLLRLAEKIADRRNYQIKDFSTVKEIRQWASRVVAVHQESFAGTHQWHPDTPEETNLVVSGLLSIADPRLIKLILHNNQVIGFAFCFPDLAIALRKSGGRLLPLGWWHLRHAFSHSSTLLANGVGMLPKYQNLGGNALLYTRLWQEIQKLHRFERVDIVQVNENNFKSRSDMETLGAQWIKRHRSYTRELLPG